MEIETLIIIIVIGGILYWVSSKISSAVERSSSEQLSRDGIDNIDEINNFMKSLAAEHEASSKRIAKLTEQIEEMEEISSLLESGIDPDMPFEDAIFQTIEEALVDEEGWDKNEIGDSGQPYRIDIDNAGNSVLKLHELVQENYGGYRNTPINNLLSPGRYLLFDPKGLDKSGLSDLELADLHSWLGFIKEHIVDGTTIEEIFENPYLITGFLAKSQVISATRLGTSTSVCFPLLILVRPEFVKISKKINS